MTHALRWSAAALIAALASPASAYSHAESYRVYLGGLPLATLRSSLQAKDGAYQAEGAFDLSFLLAFALDSDATARASGRLTPDGKAHPQAFSYDLQDRGKTQRTLVSFDPEGRPTQIDTTPPPPARPYDLKLEQTQKAVDPASALVMSSAPRPDPCAFDQEVFDGRKLHRVTFSPAEQDPDEKGVICSGVYERLAGFPAKDLTPERARYQFRVMFSPADEGSWRLEKVWAESAYGRLSVVRRNR